MPGVSPAAVRCDGDAEEEVALLLPGPPPPVTPARSVSSIDVALEHAAARESLEKEEDDDDDGDREAEESEEKKSNISTAGKVEEKESNAIDEEEAKDVVRTNTLPRAMANSCEGRGAGAGAGAEAGAKGVMKEDAKEKEADHKSQQQDRIASHCGFSVVVPGFLLIASRAVAQNPALLRRCGIRSVLNCTGYDQRRPFSLFHSTDLLYPSPELEGVDSLHLVMEDGGTLNLFDIFDEAIAYLDRCASEREGYVVVHCEAGISRSVTLVLAYLIQRRRMRLADALAMVRRARPVAAPHKNFVRALIEWEAECREEGGPLHGDPLGTTADAQQPSLSLLQYLTELLYTNLGGGISRERIGSVLAAKRLDTDATVRFLLPEVPS